LTAARGRTLRRAGTRLLRTLPNVRRVRGGQERLPLALDAALALGCCAAVGADARARPLAEGFNRAELEVRALHTALVGESWDVLLFVLSTFAPRSPLMPPGKMAMLDAVSAVTPGPLRQA